MKTTERNYWLDLFSGQSWQEFIEAGSTVTGFNEHRWSTAQKIKVGDYLICYLTGLSRFIAILEVTEEAYKDFTPIWKDGDFPCRLKVKPFITLPLEYAIPVRELADKLSFASMFEANSNRWTGHFRGSPAKWKLSDGDIVLAALLDAQDNPVNRPFDSAKLKRKPKVFKAKIGSVTVPEIDEPVQQISKIEVEKEATAHTEIQWLLLKLGNDMGLDVWVARNDRNRQYKNNQFNELPRIKSELPLQFDEVTNKTIELIDVLWLKGNAIAAAFEIESTTSIYSGLLRMSDLISMQPNLNIPLYLVAPIERREKVFTEVNRPTFSRLTPAMSKMCRYISFDALREQVNQVASVVRYLKPEFLEEVSESCEIEEL